ncbi:hypothetical protein VCHC64A1_01691A, partial [Vibrio cholerae HC-64A1]
MTTNPVPSPFRGG